MKSAELYAIRDRAIPQELVRLVGTFLFVFIKDRATVNKFLNALFGMEIKGGKPRFTEVKLTKRHGLFVLVLAFATTFNGLGGAAATERARQQSSQEAGLSPNVPAGTTTVPPAILTTMPRTTINATSKPLSGIDVCGEDPAKILRRLFAASKQATAGVVAKLIAARGPHTTGCPGLSPIQVGNFTVVPLRSFGGQVPSYVAVDGFDRAVIVLPSAFGVLGSPDATLPQGFSQGALSDRALVRIEGPSANAAPTGRGWSSGSSDRVAFMYEFGYVNGSCAAAFRTEPQKEFLLLPASVSTLAAGVLAAGDFVSVSSTDRTTFKVKIFRSDGSYRDEVAINYAVPEASLGKANTSSPSRATDAEACHLGSLLQGNYLAP